MRRGVVLVMTMLIVVFMGITLLLLWQARLLLSAQRSASLGDLMAATYAAESQAMDIAKRFLDGFVVDESGTVDLNGTRLTFDNQTTNGTQTIIITSSRPLATYKLQVSREVGGTTESNFDEIEVMFNLDCSGSMRESAGDPADPSKNRLTAAKEALMVFANEVKGSPESHRIKIGLVVFRGNWNLVFSPSNNYNISDPNSVIRKINDGITSDPDTGTCNWTGRRNGTNVGGSVSFTNSYFSQNSPSFGDRTKRIIVLITDGDTITRVPDSYCDYFLANGQSRSANNIICHEQTDPNSYFCSTVSAPLKCDIGPDSKPIMDNRCRVLSRMNTACAMASQNQSISYESQEFDVKYLSNIAQGFRDSVRSFYNFPVLPGGVQSGMRNPKVDLYAVTVHGDISSQEINLYTDFTSGFFPLSNASNLSTVLRGLLDQIISGSELIKIIRVVPGS